MKTDTPFLSMLAAAVNGGKPAVLPASAEEWREVYDLAGRHTVRGLLFDVVEGLPAGSGIPKELAATWMMEVRDIEADYRRMVAIVEKQRGTWRRHGVNAVLLKGLETAACYPVPSRRTFGDIDWWMKDEESWDRALGVLDSNGIRWSEDSDGDISYELAGVMVEHHRKGLAEESDEGRLLHLSCHILHHAMVMGAGLRQVCDYALALKHYSPSLDRTRYAELAAPAGLSRWTEALHSLLAVLGLLPDGWSDNGVDVGVLLELVLSDGNFGLDKRNRLSGLGKRTLFFVRICPKAFFRRWAGLIIGRISRK